jgi:hypothetical protein
MFRKVIAVYCENHAKHINTLCGQNAESFNIEAGGMYGYHRSLKGKGSCVCTGFCQRLSLAENILRVYHGK